MPSNREEMLNIDGVTENKFEEFGDDFLEVSNVDALCIAVNEGNSAAPECSL